MVDWSRSYVRRPVCYGCARTTESLTNKVCKAGYFVLVATVFMLGVIAIFSKTT